MQNQFINRQLFGKRIITFDDTEVKIQTSHRFAGSRMRSFRLDEISHRPEYRKINRFSSSYFYILIASIVISLSYIFAFNSIYSILGFILLVFIIFKAPLFLFKEQMIEIKTKYDPIMIYITNKTQEAGEKFVNDLIQASKNFLIRKFAYIDPDIPASRQYENYRWLLHNDLIDQEAYEKLKKELKSVIANTTN